MDKRSLGGRKNGTSIISKTLDEVLHQIYQETRRQEVYDFFTDIGKCLVNLSKVLATGGHACFVLGNRTVNGVQIPADDILIELGKQMSLSKENIFYRHIPNKRIPWKSSPTNVAGKTVRTMNKESIVILRKT